MSPPLALPASLLGLRATRRTELDFTRVLPHLRSRKDIWLQSDFHVILFSEENDMSPELAHNQALIPYHQSRCPRRYHLTLFIVISCFSEKRKGLNTTFKVLAPQADSMTSLQLPSIHSFMLTWEHMEQKSCTVHYLGSFQIDL